MSDLEKKFLSILQAALQNRSSDVHLSTNQAAALRANGALVAVQLPAFTAEELQVLAQFMIADPKLKATAPSLQELEGAFEVKGLGRFRYSLFRTAAGLNAVLRVIPAVVPSLDELKLSAGMKKIAEERRGLVLVTGGTGTGKSSTLAAMLDHINTFQSLHVITIESPVEYVHAPKRARLSQRELGRDTASFAQGLKAALRQDPDVILLSEIRDAETLDLALQAAELGQLVFATLAASDAVKTVNRLISLFPANQEAGARARISENLKAVVSQRIMAGKAGGKVVAQEILLNTAEIAECIANEKKSHEIAGLIEAGKEQLGMQTFDQHLAELVMEGRVAADTAVEQASHPGYFQRNLSLASADDAGKSSLSLEEVAEKEEAPPAAAAPPAPGAMPGGAPTPFQPPRPGAPTAPAGSPPRPALTPMNGGLNGGAAPRPATPPPTAAAPGNYPKIPKIPA